MEKKAKGKKMGGIGHLFGVKLVEKFIEFARRFFLEKILEFTLKWALVIGHFSLIVAAVLGLLFAIIYAIRVNDFYAFLYGIAWVILVFVIQYIAHKFSDAGENLIKNNPTRLASKAFLDCVAFIFMIAGLVLFIVSVINLIKTGELRIFLTGLGMAVFCEFIAMVSYNYKTITMDVVKETRAGQEAIGIITFFMKALLKLIPLFFGVGVVLGTVFLFINSFGLFGNQFEIASAWISGSRTAEQIILAGFLPFIGYILFVLYYLVIDIITAILSLPEKIDKLKK